MAGEGSVATVLMLLLLGTVLQVDAAKHKEGVIPPGPYVPGPIAQSDVELLEFPLNLEYLEAEFFLFGTYGYGLDKVAPELPARGPAPKGGRKAKLSRLVREVIADFGEQEVGHLRAIRSTLPRYVVSAFQRPQLDISAATIASVINSAFNATLRPAFDPYASDINFLIASYLLPYVGLTGYVGTNPSLASPVARRLLAGLLAVESGQDAVIRALLFERRNQRVKPYPWTVAEFTNRISALRDKLDGGAEVDQGLTMDGGRVARTLSGDANSVGFSRTQEQILRIVYSSGNASIPGGIYPDGGNGKIARSFLQGHRRSVGY